MGPVLRERNANDDEFLFELYLDTRIEEMQAWGWVDAQMQAFARMQFYAKQSAYAAQYPDALDRVIVVNGKDAGRMMTARSDTEIRLVDIAVMRDFRGRGIGKIVLRDLIIEANAAGLPITLQVEMFNPARHWYESLGFTTRSENGGYYLMTLRPDA